MNTITSELNTEELFASLDETWSIFVDLISSADTNAINTIPFKDCWTIAQVTIHVTKSNKAIMQALNMEGKPAERDPEATVPNLKKIFLDFDAKFQSPDFIVPEKGIYNKEEIIESLKRSLEQLQELRNKVNLTEIISLPIFGEITKLELLHFVLYHTTRHIHQLKNIIKKLN
ncbi:MAG: DinB family protein [Parafilimonas sp.]